MNELSSLFSDYRKWYEPEMDSRWLRPGRWQLFLDRWRSSSAFRMETCGTSVLGRPITAIYWGNGTLRHLIWTQMHGDESTATRAVADLMNLLGSSETEKEILNSWKSKVTLCFVPMLNPDGSEAYTRRNAQGLDPNRDVRALQTPEMRSLVELAGTFQPHWAWNMHDQRNFYSCGAGGDSATMSFLAPVSDAAGTLTPARKEAMQMLSLLMSDLNVSHRCGIGRYSEEFYPTAAGEYFQATGARTVLIESGHAQDFPSREWQRQMNFELLLNGIYHTVKEDYTRVDEKGYFKYPELGKSYFDLVVRNVELPAGGRADLGFMLRLDADHMAGCLKESWVLEDLGDLNHMKGHREWTDGPYRLKDPLPGLGTRTDPFTLLGV